jgi:hypothetical protein
MLKQNACKQAKGRKKNEQKQIYVCDACHGGDVGRDSGGRLQNRNPGVLRPARGTRWIWFYPGRGRSVPVVAGDKPRIETVEAEEVDPFAHDDEFGECKARMSFGTIKYREGKYTEAK